MFRKYSAVLIPLALASAPYAAQAQPWSGEVSAGYVATSGNTDTSTSNAKAEVVYTQKAWRNTFNALAINSEQAGLRTTERYAFGDKADINLTEHDYAFLSVEFEKDLFGAVRERTSETAGYGRKILTGPEHTLEAEIGGGARQTEAQGTGEKASDTIGRGRLAYKWKFTETSHFGQVVKVESGESNTFTEAVTDLKLALVGKLFATASYTLRQNSDVPPLAKKTDTITTIGLGWSFGK